MAQLCFAVYCCSISIIMQSFLSDRPEGMLCLGYIADTETFDCLPNQLEEANCLSIAAQCQTTTIYVQVMSRHPGVRGNGTSLKKKKKKCQFSLGSRLSKTNTSFSDACKFDHMLSLQCTYTHTQELKTGWVTPYRQPCIEVDASNVDQFDSHWPQLFGFLSQQQSKVCKLK